MENTGTQFIGKYEVIATLGRGSMGVVYKARDPEIGRVVAIKTLRSVFMGEDAAGNEALQRFRQESRSAGRLQHPNIVTIFEAGRTDNGSPYIVMEFFDGYSLDAINSQRAPLDPLEVLHYLAQVGSAIDYAHRQNVIHRDIKPSNIIVDAQHRPHLLDFGVAKLSDTSLTPAGTVVGTPSYMSPEQIRGDTLDGASDRFAFAVVAFELFTGMRPFPGQDFTTVVSNIINKEPLTLAQANSPHLPAELSAVLAKGLSKAKADRYPTALEFVDAAAKALGATIDGTGLVGGYNAQMKWQPAASSVRAPEAKAAPAPVQPEMRELPTAAPVEPSTKRRGGLTAVLILVFVLVALTGAGAYLVFNGMIKLQPELPKRAEVEPAKTEPAPEPDAAMKLTTQNVSAGPSASAGQEPPPPPPQAVQPPQQAVQPPPKEVEQEVAEVAVPPPPTGPVIPTSEGQVSGLSSADLSAFLRTNNASAQLTRAAIEEVYRRGDASFAAAVADAAAHEDFRVKIDAIKLLSRSPFSAEPVAKRCLIGLLSDADPLVRGFAAKFLSPWSGEEGLRALKERAAVETDQRAIVPMRQSITQIESELQK